MENENSEVVMSKKDLAQALKEDRRVFDEQTAELVASQPATEDAIEITDDMIEYAVSMEVLSYCQKNPSASDDVINEYKTKSEMKLDANPKLAAQYAFIEKYNGLKDDEKNGVDYVCYEAMADYLEEHPTASPYDLLSIRSNVLKEVMLMPNLKEKLPEFAVVYQEMEKGVEKLDEDGDLEEKTDKRVEKYAKAHKMDKEDMNEDIYACIAFKCYREALKEDKGKSFVKEKMNLGNILAERLR